MQVAVVLEPGLYLPEAHIICGWVVVAVERRARVVQTFPSFSLPNLILYLGIPCALVKLME